MRGVLYISRISSFVQSYRGALAFTAFHTAVCVSGSGGGVAGIGENASFTGVLNDRFAVVERALMEWTAARFDDMINAIVAYESR